MITKLELGAGALADYYGWLRGAAHGAVLVYHVGDLSFDRLHDETPEERVPDARLLDAVATRIGDDAAAGVLRLSQRRLGTSLYEYRATRLRLSGEPAYSPR